MYHLHAGFVWVWPGPGAPPELPSYAAPPSGFLVHAEIEVEVPVEHGLLMEVRCPPWCLLKSSGGYQQVPVARQHNVCMTTTNLSAYIMQALREVIGIGLFVSTHGLPRPHEQSL